jgi:putative NIF3 family GTP cyclohydrolase 1 type 2
MAVSLSTLVEEADRYLGSARIADYCPNGLQVEGRPQVRRIVSGVTASQALLDAAVAAEADLVLVHHGYFWKGENPCVVGMKQRRLKTLLRHDISLLAYHLPLDVHPEVGNNAQLAAHTSGGLVHRGRAGLYRYRHRGRRRPVLDRRGFGTNVP